MFTRLLHLHEKFARDEKIAPDYVCVCVCVCACVCVRAYVCRACCNINARIKIYTREWVVGSRLWCYKIVCFESQHHTTNKVVVRPAKTQISLGIRPVWSESVRPAKTQISLGIRPVWSESSLGALSVTKRPNDSSCGQRRLWSDWADDQTDLGYLLGAQISNERARFDVLL